VLWNLLTNAVKFTGADGTIVVGARVEASDMVLSVSDTGDGISADFLPQVFERFRQADGSTTRSHGGLGLGLAIVKRLTELHGGSVSASSAGLGMGATFTIRLPIAEEHSPARVERPEGGQVQPDAGSSSGSGIEGLKVLLVEDDADGRAMVEELLTHSGGQVRAVESAASALGALAECAFDVVISDIGMPDIDGYELLERMRAAGNQVPAIALTAFARTEDRDRALKAGFVTHLSKPVEPPALIAAVAGIGRRG
jgi:CheY-like chemotaxis protein